MMTATFTRDVEFDVEVDTDIKATSDVVNFTNSSNKKMKVKIKGKNIENAKLYFCEACGYDLSTEQLLNVIFSDLNTIEDLRGGKTDTVAIDHFRDAFSRFMLKCDWPKGGPLTMDDPRLLQYETFFADLKIATEEMGIFPMPGFH